MPLLDYICEDCEHQFEEWKTPQKCPECGSDKVRIYIKAAALKDVH